jgi:hypothetical protein
MDFYPPLSERSDKELFNIISNDENWQEEIQQLANEELLKRHYTIDKIKKEKDHRKAIIANYTDRQERQKQINAAESYTLLKMLLIILTFPFSLAFFGRPLEEFSRLEKYNYRKKFRQRIVLIGLSILFWLLCIKLIF